MDQETILGIDLGTTMSCVAVVQDGRPTIVPNRGYLTTPSVVALAADGKLLVGHMAKRQAITNAANTVAAMKRFIGRRFDATPDRDGPQGANLVAGPSGEVKIRLGDRLFAVAELNALILSELKNAAATHLGREVSKAVITVPAYFDDHQRQATRDAGTLAGLQVVRMINEPTAAAISYGFGRAAKKTIVVYDFGGGTFDISIVRIHPDGLFEVLGTGGDTFLGGEDVDRAVSDWIATEFRKAQGFELPKDATVVQRLKEAAEAAKCALSSQQTADIELPSLAAAPNGGRVHHRGTLSRATFDALVQPLVERTISHTGKALDLAQLSIADIDDLLLVGGSSRIPAVHHAVTTFLGRKPSQGVHPDEAVALGAAAHAHALGQKSALRLHDVTPHTLGVRLRGNRLEAIIPKNTRIPASKTRKFSTVRDQQTHVDVIVLQGDSDAADRNLTLAALRFADLRPAAAGEVSVDVTFSIDESGVVTVQARDRETNRTQAIRAVASSGTSAVELRERTQGTSAISTMPPSSVSNREAFAASSEPVVPLAPAPAPELIGLPPLPSIGENPGAASSIMVARPAPNLSTATPSAVSPVATSSASPVKMSAFGLEVMEIAANLERLVGRAKRDLGVDPAIVEAVQTTVDNARRAAAGGDDGEMRNAAFDMAKAEQTLGAVLG